ncbi:glutaminyl-peptide cyclotransferase [Zhouia amylolytica]|uniref:glutaminyl-peptide cyclotransferase n=1 Tax=Zhouia amylolytica TaxID=376730 RepID=UPI0020CE262D|nr:glutaminyl-peptide cyclotransferase [Zhouia amylolytica]MCQ0110796.1 glutaminyl-peptide cyclotransferase [Zhouia amylolytica]
MRTHKILIISFLSVFALSCNGKHATKKNRLSLEITSENKNIHLNDEIRLAIKNPKQLDISSVDYTLNGNPINVTSNKLQLTDVKLGKHLLEAHININDDEPIKISKSFIVFNNTAPKIYTYKILNEYPHDIEAFTQGLEFYNDTLYEGTGRRGLSKLMKIDYKTGEVYKEIKLANSYFGEGISILNDKVYQLTWESKTGFVYDVDNFKKLETFTYNASKEGWGLCNDGQQLYKSDGTERIWTLNPETLQEENHIEVYTNKAKLQKINELEFVNNKIYANTWQFEKEVGVIINPENGAVEGVIDFSGLKEKVKQHAGLDVLNGIAYNPSTRTFFVTGKKWNKLFEVEILEK